MPTFKPGALNGSLAVPNYRGQRFYQKGKRAVTDGNVITANGLAPFAFASEIFRNVAAGRENDIAMYEVLYLDVRFRVV